LVDRYAVIGNPIAHSRSPDIHALFAHATGQRMDYRRVLCPVDGFAATVESLRRDGFRGANVTLPFKRAALELATTRSTRAEAAGAANTLTFSDEGIHADNTDGVGLVRDITQNLGVDFTGASVLLIGAGGAARGVLRPMLLERPACVVIANRSIDNARAIAHDLGAPTAVDVVALDSIQPTRHDIIINATSAGLAGGQLAIPPACFAHHTLAYDMVYADTPFLRDAARLGARTADGLGMLVEQAAEAFAIWRGVRPDTTPVLASLRTQPRA
jgi:shikimate dehydrogenase